MSLATLKSIKRTATFTQFLTPDTKVPTVEAAKHAGDDLLRTARGVIGSFTWVTPEKREKYELISVSPTAMNDVGLAQEEEKTELFTDVMAGQHVFDDTYPWAQAYAGYQFGVFAGQLGDGRAISLFEATNPVTGKRYELQLKGAGLTPYSRFADGKAVLRSSIREALGCEYVNALGIPTSRALALVNLPETYARRETTETCAIVCRMAETWVRFGTFDLHRARGNRAELRKLADYCIKHVFGGEDKLIAPKSTDVYKSNRYQQLYREIAVRNARTLAYWQAYAFMNGVLNTDNTSVYGLSIDYGPFAFMDTFDPSFTPNHDDGQLRYAYKNQPTAIWWNLIRLGESIGELLGAEPNFVDDSDFIENGVTNKEELIDGILKRAEKVIMDAGEEFQKAFVEKYDELMAKRLGLLELRQDDHKDIFSSLLDMLEECELDYNHFFRRLGDCEFFGGKAVDSKIFLPETREFAPLKTPEECVEAIDAWIAVYVARLEAEGQKSDAERQERMRAVNPKFILKNWILDEVIEKAREKNFTLYHQVQKMSLDPFAETWGLDKSFEDRYTGDAPRSKRSMQCSCSS